MADRVNPLDANLRQWHESLIPETPENSDGSMRPVDTPLRARYIIFYRSPSVPKTLRSGFLTLEECYRYALTVISTQDDLKVDHIYDVLQRKPILEVHYPV